MAQGHVAPDMIDLGLLGSTISKFQISIGVMLTRLLVCLFLRYFYLTRIRKEAPLGFARG